MQTLATGDGPQARSALLDTYRPSAAFDKQFAKHCRKLESVAELAPIVDAWTRMKAARNSIPAELFPK